MADDFRQAAQDAVSRTLEASEALRVRAMQSLASGAATMARVMPSMIPAAAGFAADARMGIGMVQAGAAGATTGMGPLGALNPNPYGAPMGFLGAMYTAYSPLPGAAQFVSMDPSRARELARGYASTRYEQVAANMWYGAANFASGGLFDYSMRLSGQEVGTDRSAVLARNVLQRRFHGFGADVLGGDVSVFGQGLGDRGLTRARELLMGRGGALSRLQRETLFGSEQLLELADIGGQFAGVGEMQRLGKRGGLNAIVGALGGGARDVLEITRSLGIDTETLQQYREVMDRVVSNLADMKGMAQTASRQAIATHQDREVIFQGIASAREIARSGFMGMETGGGTFTGLQAIYQQQMEAGLMPQSEIMRFGGRRDASTQMALARMRENTQRIQAGAANPFLTIMHGMAGGADFLMGGVRSPMAFQQALGGVLARDPFAGIRAQIDPSALNMASAGLDLMMFRQAQQMGGIPGMDPVMVTQRFAQLMGIDIREAAMRQRMLEAERSIYGSDSAQGVARTIAGMGAAGLPGFDAAAITAALAGQAVTQTSVLRAGFQASMSLGGPTQSPVEIIDTLIRGGRSASVAESLRGTGFTASAAGLETDPVADPRRRGGPPVRGMLVDTATVLSRIAARSGPAAAAAIMGRLAKDVQEVATERFFAAKGAMFSDVHQMLKDRGLGQATSAFYDSDNELMGVSVIGSAVARAFTGEGKIQSFEALIAAMGGVKGARAQLREITGVANFAADATTARQFEAAFGGLDVEKQKQARQMLEMWGLGKIREEINMSTRRDGSSPQRALFVQGPEDGTAKQTGGKSTDGE